jgi:quercetin dioxygenase-like cupin family protein
MVQAVRGVVRDPSDETIHVGPLVIRFLVSGADSGGSLAMFECGVPGGEPIPAPSHSHDGFEETIYGLEGVLTWTVDGAPVEIGPRQVLCIPRGAVHRFDNHGAADAKVLIVATPGVFGPAYFREIAAVMADAAGGPPDHARMGEVLRRHGLTPALSGT